MVHFTYIKKFNTIIKDSNLNTGINPISEIIYGKNLTRTLLYFDHNEIKRLIDEGKMPDSSKMTHRLKIKNAGSIDFSELHSCYTSSIDDMPKKRASSFSLIFFLIPKSWDAGKGFDYSRNFFNEDFYDSAHKDKSRFLSTDGCNWYQARNDEKWDEDGVYSYNTLKDEYDKFKIDGHSDIIFAEQRFDVGAEDIDIDIDMTDFGFAETEDIDIDEFFVEGTISSEEEAKLRLWRVRKQWHWYLLHSIL